DLFAITHHSRSTITCIQVTSAESLVYEWTEEISWHRQGRSAVHHPTSSFLRPARLDEALRWLSEPGSVVLSGGTDFVPERWHRLRVETVVDISNISALRGIERRPDGWRIGAGTTWQEIARANLPPAFDGLRRAARSIGGVQIQNVATLGGNLCTASPAADGIPPPLTLAAPVGPN